MPRSLRAYTALTLLIGAVACAGDPPAEAPAAPPPAAAAADEHAHPTHDAEPAAATDEVYALDEHTRTSLAALGALLTAGPETDDVAGHQALGAALDVELKGLIRGCTMEGPAHDRLHVWLMEFMPKVRGMQEGDDLAALQALRNEAGALVTSTRTIFE